jgi:hypothetical protein
MLAGLSRTEPNIAASCCARLACCPAGFSLGSLAAQPQQQQHSCQKSAVESAPDSRPAGFSLGSLAAQRCNKGTVHIDGSIQKGTEDIDGWPAAQQASAWEAWLQSKQHMATGLDITSLIASVGMHMLAGLSRTEPNHKKNRTVCTCSCCQVRRQARYRRHRWLNAAQQPSAWGPWLHSNMRESSYMWVQSPS